jgi:uncharacterized membrane protein
MVMRVEMVIMMVVEVVVVLSNQHVNLWLKSLPYELWRGTAILLSTYNGHSHQLVLFPSLLREVPQDSKAFCPSLILVITVLEVLRAVSSFSHRRAGTA